MLAIRRLYGEDANTILIVLSALTCLLRKRKPAIDRVLSVQDLAYSSGRNHVILVFACSKTPWKWTCSFPVSVKEGSEKHVKGKKTLIQFFDHNSIYAPVSHNFWARFG